MGVASARTPLDDEARHAVPSILVIDDEEHFRAFLRLVLEGAGHHVREAAGGPAGVAAYRRARADVVLCDLFMPRQGGLGVIRKLRRLSTRARVVAMSDPALVPDGLLGAALRAGACGALLKPFTPAELLDAVRQALAG
jgi:CheY-like chemotaxis protein